MGAAHPGGLVDGSRRNAILGWAIALGLAALAVLHAFEGTYRWFVFTVFAVVVMVAPAITCRDPRAMPPWTLLALVAIPVVETTLLGETVLTSVAVYVAVAAVSLVIVLEIHRLTTVRMNHTFAIALVAITTLAVAATWNVALWLSDVLFGTAYIVTGRSEDAANHAMMMDFVYAAVAGLLGGLVFDRFVMDPAHTSDRADAGGEPTSLGDPAVLEASVESVPPLLRGRFDVSDHIVDRLSYTLQVALALLLLYGLLTRDVTAITNAAIALAITAIPTALERDPHLSLEPELVLWLTGAVFLHALGSAGLYDLLGPWDSLTHAVSASIVAGAGYAVVRAVDLYSEEVHLPPAMLFVFILLFVLAFGVVWELMEFGLDLLGAWLGYEMVLAQHGIVDTIGDLFYDLVGAVVVATWGSVYLTDVSHRIADRFDR